MDLEELFGLGVKVRVKVIRSNLVWYNDSISSNDLFISLPSPISHIPKYDVLL